MCTSWTGRVRREERRARMREENNTHTHTHTQTRTLLFHSWPTGTTTQDYLLSLTSYSLSLSLKEAHIRPDSPTNALTHTQLAKDECAASSRLLHTHTHSHTLSDTCTHALTKHSGMFAFWRKNRQAYQLVSRP